MKMEAAFGLGPFHPIRKTLLMPNMMGFFAYIPDMECYHDVISMNHRFHGLLRVDDQVIGFHEGKGYIEKDWGTSFPKKYIWIQCNHFKKENLSVFCSAADIPFRKKSFTGFICCLVIDQTEYRFATYNNSKFELERVADDQILLSFQSRTAKLRIEASLKGAGELIAPHQGRMQDVLKEGIREGLQSASITSKADLSMRMRETWPESKFSDTNARSPEITFSILFLSDPAFTQLDLIG